MRQRRAYAAIREAHEETGYPIELACKLLHAARSAYHKWASGKLSQRAAENERLADTLEKIHEESPDKGYRRLNDDLRHEDVYKRQVFLIVCVVKAVRMFNAFFTLAKSRFTVPSSIASVLLFCPIDVYKRQILAVTKPEIIAEQIITNWFINIGVDLYSNKLSITYIYAIC